MTGHAGYGMAEKSEPPRHVSIWPLGYQQIHGEVGTRGPTHGLLQWVSSILFSA